MSTETVTRTTGAGAGQDGITLLGGWQETATEMIAAESGFPSRIGLTFDWQLGVDALGTTLKPPRISLSPVPTLVLTTSASQADPGAGRQFELYADESVAPSLWPTGGVPFSGSRSSLLISAAELVWTGAPSTLTFTFGTYVTEANAATALLTTPNWKTLRDLYLSAGGWNGRLALSIKALDATGASFATSEAATGAPVLTTTETPFFTGWVGRGVNRNTRSVYCERSGLPAMADELVDDGYLPGLKVKPRWWDPRDRRNEAELPDTERQIDDEVSN